MKRAAAMMAIGLLFAWRGVDAGQAQASVTIRVSVAPAALVADGRTVTITATTSQPVSDVWIFAGTISDIVNVAYVASCDAPLGHRRERCIGHARHAGRFMYLPDPPYRQSKRAGLVQTFFACWDSITPANCSQPIRVSWKRGSLQ